MNINWKLVSGLLATVVVYDETVSLINAHRFRALKARIKSLKMQNRYLAEKLDEYEIPVTEFDRIVHQYLNE